MIPENYPYNVGFEWAPPYRVHRIEEVITGIRDGRKKITLDDMEKLQTDVVSLPARRLVNLLKESPNPTVATQMIRGWDATLSRESGVAALYEVWLKELRKVVAEKKGVESFEDDLFENVLEDLSEPSPQFFGADAVAGRNQVLLQTLESAWKRTEQLLGTDPQKWSWGRLHTIQFRHSLDGLPDLATLLDLGPLPRPGDGDTVNATWADKKFEQEEGASYREILDTADWDRSLVVNTPGQSGQPGSSHYSDLLPLWDRGEYFPLLYSRKAVEMNAQDRLKLAPN
jgi:penicillin amidase